MSLWVKICANTSLSDAQYAVEAGADALGFVFAPSPRRVTPSQVAAITPHLPADIEKIGVFVDATSDQIVATVDEARLTGVQLHAAAGRELTAHLRGVFGPHLRILRVVHFGPEAQRDAEEFASDSNVNGILIDSRTATAVGGTGVAFDWKAASQTIFQDASGQKRLIAAGGLNPDNVAEAIVTLAPWGVDVASGVESSPGRKDRGKVFAFIANARAAARS